MRRELVCKKIKSHTCFELNEEDMASSSRAFRKPKNAEEERKLLESATPKSTQAVTKWSLKIFGNGRMVGKNKSPAIEPCAFRTDNSKVQRLDTDIANIPLPDYGSNVIQNFSGSVFNNCTINFVQK